MRKLFPGYYPPTPSEVADLWNSAEIAIDANVLLSLYRYSDATASDLLTVLTNLKARLRIPHQFALEFSRNRTRVILEQARKYVDAEDAIEGLLRDFRSPRQHPHVSPAGQKLLVKVQKELRQRREIHEGLLQKDPRCDMLLAFSDQLVSPPLTPERLTAAYDEGRQRVTSKTPPGYMDASKPEPGRYGDYIGWIQLIDMAKASKKPLIFVTADAKEDWWLIISGKTLSPRPELIDEFKRTAGTELHMYSFDTFLVQTKERLGQRVTDAVLKEVRLHIDNARDAPDLKPREAEPPPATSDAPKASSAKPDLRDSDDVAPKLTEEEVR